MIGPDDADEYMFAITIGNHQAPQLSISIIDARVCNEMLMDKKLSFIGYRCDTLFGENGETLATAGNQP